MLNEPTNKVDTGEEADGPVSTPSGVRDDSSEDRSEVAEEAEEGSQRGGPGVEVGIGRNRGCESE